MSTSEKRLMKGNEAFAIAAIRSGCRFYFGYPITPQNEIPEYMSRELSKVGGSFIQAESELAAINMAYGASAAGGSAAVFFFAGYCTDAGGHVHLLFRAASAGTAQCYEGRPWNRYDPAVPGGL